MSRARADLCGGRLAMIVPTATAQTSNVDMSIVSATSAPRLLKRLCPKSFVSGYVPGIL